MAVSPVELRGEPSCNQLPQLLKDSKVWISETCPTVGQKEALQSNSGCIMDKLWTSREGCLIPRHSEGMRISNLITELLKGRRQVSALNHSTTVHDLR
jgi:hypothetical protein